MNEEHEQQGGREAELKQELIDLLRDLEVHGVDFSEDDLDFLSAMDDEELAGYFIMLLEAAGVLNPLEFMESHNLVDVFRNLTPEELADRNSRKLKGEGHRVDELDQRDLEAGNT
jgi:hypothetical protein